MKIIILLSTSTVYLQPHFTVINNSAIVGFSFKPSATSTVASFGFGSTQSSPANAAAAVSTTESSHPLGTGSTGFAFSRPLQPSGASVNFGTGSFSFGNTSGFSFKPPEPTVTENKGE